MHPGHLEKEAVRRVQVIIIAFASDKDRQVQGDAKLLSFHGRAQIFTRFLLCVANKPNF